MDKKQRSPKKQFIIETAARLFRDKGYRATSMRDLADAVDLKASSLYSHIKSKEELLRDICFENAHRFVNSMEAIEQEYNEPLDQLKALVALHITIALQDPTSITSFNDEWQHLSEPFLSEFLSLRKDYEKRFQQIIDAGKAKGVIKNLPTNMIFYTLLSSLRWIYDWYKPERNQDTTDIVEHLQEIILGGIVK